MFGYITINTGELTEAQTLRYRARYCGLCRALLERHGNTGRLTLSNDMTFLLTLLSSLYEPAEERSEGTCPVHPIHKRERVRSRLTDYAADMNFLLAYWKCVDNSRDEHDLLQGQLARSMEKQVASLTERYPRQAKAIEEALAGISALETAGSEDVDALCRLSGQLLAEVFVPEEDVFAPVLRRVGCSLGAYVYLMDAYEDYEEDHKKKRFNPLTSLHAQADYEELIREALIHFAAEATEACELLPLTQDADLISHVLRRGLWTRYAQLQQKDEKKAEAKPPEDACGAPSLHEGEVTA